MLIKVYRLYSEGSVELFESFIWDLLLEANYGWLVCLFVFQ